MRPSKQFLITTVAASLVSASASAQGLVDVRAIKPVMMLMVDSSGSMERKEGDVLPNCSGNPTSDVDQRSRWTITLEALTGTFTNFSCSAEDRSTYDLDEYDYGYYLPHFTPLDWTQTSDGVIDAYEYAVKFGLMTFDGMGTYVDGNPLIPYSSSLVFPEKDRIEGSGGMYSYGDTKRLSFPGCESDYGVNFGVRGPSGADTHAGALISVGTSDDAPEVANVNNLVQQSLLGVRPYGGTPIAAVLDDLRYWLNHSPDVMPATASPGQDYFYSCRQRFGVLLTDGAPDSLFRDSRYACHESTDGQTFDRDGLGIGDGDTCAPDSTKGGTTPACECPYETEVAIATDLVQNEGLDQLFVVAFNITDPDALAQLDLIADAGKTGAAVQATNPQELRAALNIIFEQAQPKATSRTVPVVVNHSVNSFVVNGTNYEVSAGFRVAQTPDSPWQGILERKRLQCGGTNDIEVIEQPITSSGCATAGGVCDSFDKRLNAQTTRQITTLRPSDISLTRGTLRTAHARSLDARTFPFSPDDTVNQLPADGSTNLQITFQADSTANAGQRAVDSAYLNPVPFADSDTSLNAQFFGDADGNGTPGQAADRTRIVSFVDGSSRDPLKLAAGTESKLADIYHSNPVVLPLLDANTSDDRLNVLRAQIEQSYGTGTTRPPTVFVGTNDGVLHAFNLDTWQTPMGTAIDDGHEFWGFVPPALFDKLASAAIPTHQLMFDGGIVVRDMVVRHEAGTNAYEFRSILLAAVGGTPAYVALDVTHPEQAPKPLWQFSAEYMGETIATPALAQVLVKWGTGPIEERAVAILPGGAGVENASGPTTCFDRGQGKAKAPDDARSQGRCWRNRGRALYVVDVATGNVLQEFNQNHFPAPITGSVTVDGRELGLSSSAYFSDEDGVVWHLDLRSTDPTKWRVTSVFDLFHGGSRTDGRPAKSAPVLTTDFARNNVLLLATGDVDNLTDAAKHRVYSLTERRTYTTGPDSTVSLALDFVANWEIALQSGEAVTGPVTLLDEVVYFSTFTGAGATGDACALGSSSLWGVHYLYPDPDALPLPMGMLEDVSSGTPTVVRSMVAEQNSVVMGVSATRSPVCLAGTIDNNAILGSRFRATGASGGGDYELRANLGGDGGETATGSQLKQFRRKLKVEKHSRLVGFAGSVE
jgi:type IV pilus assembly protein PilY1